MSVQAAETLTMDRLDRQLVQALAIDGRASFRRLAEVLGASEQTVARRYRRLREAGAVRVLVLPDPRRFDQNWLVRVQVRPPTAVAFAEAVARREDVAWVGITAGGAEVTFAARARTEHERDALLLERLPRSRQVLGVSAAAVLHAFTGGPETEWRGLDDPLDETQVAALAKGRSRGDGGPDPSPQDAPLLAALARDGRASYAALAAETGDTEARIARRVEALLAGGALIVDVDVANALLGYSTSAWLWLTVAPGALEEVGRTLVTHPEVPFAAAVSGPANLVASVITRDTAALYAYLTGRIGAIDAVRSIELVPILRRFKQAGTFLEGPRLPAPV
jgi:DNA-binding Lrp family transcriptional regulator